MGQTHMGMLLLKWQTPGHKQKIGYFWWKKHLKSDYTIQRISSSSSSSRKWYHSDVLGGSMV
jgi:hypothetical protein